ncbi:PepSY domain-containing protein [Phenylobacterium sp.]|uniref:PepSY-associated TM helix domain-containing protein n=1 Tax=Phenylobacterium sp. TaxID=1871053 RepID=UPI002733477D|nr:PepSY domain-containing protein [Phenylobacterium sp.]MDP3660543.1 PepSY domain-containing protein [Phenylobacterium sp.]
MTDPQTSPADAVVAPFYRAFWRWHFYAGLLIMPVLMLMALTGGVYLFKDEIDGVIYRPLLSVEAAATSTTPQAWSKAATAAVPGRVVQIVPPAEPTRSVKLVVEQPSGAKRAVYVDPHDARVLGSTADGGIMRVVQRLHSLDIAGPVANRLVEIVAGWAIVMVCTGVVLWWPRGQKGGVVSIRGAPKRRVFWRDLHAVTGVFAGAIIVFLAATGMPWSTVWGGNVRKLTTEAGWGQPAPPGGGGHGAHKAAAPAPSGAVPWALQETHMHAGHHMAASLSLDDALARIDAAGLPRPYVLSIPADPGEAWSAAYMPDKVERTRTLYLDGGDGRVIADIGYGQFGPAAKTIEWGIAVHQGNQFGLVNKLIMLAGCIAVWLLGVSALVMWWKRRPKGRLAAPPRPVERKAYVALAAVVVPLAILYPLVGASLIAVLAVDLIVRRVGASMRRAR